MAIPQHIPGKIWEICQNAHHAIRARFQLYYCQRSQDTNTPSGLEGISRLHQIMSVPRTKPPASHAKIPCRATCVHTFLPSHPRTPLPVFFVRVPVTVYDIRPRPAKACTDYSPTRVCSFKAFSGVPSPFPQHMRGICCILYLHLFAKQTRKMIRFKITAKVVLISRIWPHPPTHPVRGPVLTYSTVKV